MPRQTAAKTKNDALVIIPGCDAPFTSPIMAKFGVFTIPGDSGVVYEFDAYPLNTVWTPVSAVYIVTHRDVRIFGPAEHVCLYLGEAQNIQDIPKPPPMWSKVHAANCICLLQEESEARRREIMADIAAGNSFPI
jgi:hypothetical protein